MAVGLRLLSVGQGSKADPNKVTNIVAAGLGEHATVANPDHAVQNIIDSAQATEIRPEPVPIEVVHIAKHVPISTPVHVWQGVTHEVVHLESVAIPWLEG